MTRDEQVHQIALNLKIRVRIFALKRLAMDGAAAFERADAELAKELRELIDENLPCRRRS